MPAVKAAIDRMGKWCLFWLLLALWGNMELAMIIKRIVAIDRNCPVSSESLLAR